MADLSAVYRDKAASPETRITLAVVHLGVVLAVFWYLFGGGAAAAGPISSPSAQSASALRRGVLAAAALLYLLRTLATLFVFMKRRMPWSEAVTIAVWIALFDSLFAWFGGRNPQPFGAAAALGAGLVIVGSVLNTGSEWQRLRWKRRPGNRGHLLTGGFFRLARHVNYFGDLVLFTGWALVTGRLALLAIPAVMVAGFVFANIPAQDRYLAERYGEEYRAYADRTARLIPYLY